MASDGKRICAIGEEQHSCARNPAEMEPEESQHIYFSLNYQNASVMENNSCDVSVCQWVGRKKKHLMTAEVIVNHSLTRSARSCRLLR